MATVQITFGEPVVIAQSDIEPKGRHWGPYQFPFVRVNEKGEWICSFNVVEDAASGYGKPCGYAKSTDQGKTWILQDPSAATGLLLPNGDRIRQKSQFAIPIDQVPLPAQPNDRVRIYTRYLDIYAPSDVPSELSSWYLERQRAGSDVWETERYDMDVPDLALTATQGLFPYLSVTHYRLDPKGRLWHISYPYFFDGTHPARSRPLFGISEDNGHTFRYVGDIPYHPIPECDEACEERNGYSEPDMTWLPDGSLMTLLRTTDGAGKNKGVGPMHASYSQDDGKTWSTPEFFDDLGVYPNLLTLKNGVTVVTYGRPGLFIRATADPAGKNWDDRITIIKHIPEPPDTSRVDTCSYTTLLPLDDNSFYMVYSDFQHPNAQGIPVKTIMGCTVTTKIL